MTRSLYTRNSFFMRVVSTTMALAFTLSLSGIGYATETAPPATEPAVSTSSTDAPAATGSTSGASAPAPSVEVVPAPSSPPPADPAAAPTADPAAAPAAPSSPAPSDLAASSGAPAAPDASALGAVAPSALLAPAPVLPLALPWATFQDADWQAYRISPASQVGWAKSNLGEYRENDWIPVRVYVKNDGASDIRIPGFQVVFDYLNSNKNAIAVDDAKEFRFIAVPGTTVGALPADSPYPAGTTDIGSNFTAVGSGTQFRITMATPSSDLVVPAGQTGVIYFQVHLGLTLYWNHQSPSHNGAMAYPGSSSQGYFTEWNGSAVAQKTISLPVGPAVAPKGVITGYKFNDLNHDGVRQDNEPFLSGWEFTLVFNSPYTFTKTAVSDANGMFTFTGLPEGNYTLSETMKPLWTNSTTMPMSIDLAKDATETRYVGNYVPDVTKTWTLNIASLPVGGTAFVTYTADGQAKRTDLTGTGPCTASVKLPLGTVIANVQWWINWNGEDVLLGTSSGETLSGDTHNSFNYTSTVSGTKFEDVNGNGSREGGESGLSGWTIVLKRVVGAVETNYAQTITGAEGAYSFANVIPGTYKVVEVLQNGWIQTAAPVGTFSVANGSIVNGKDFGNLHVNSSISVVKTGDAYAHVGDVVNYTIVVTNTGNYTLTNVVVTDTLLGSIGTIPIMTPGQVVTYNRTRTVLASDPDPLPNTATALGIDILGAPVSASDDHLVDILKPAISVVKTASPTMAVNPGTITYTYVVTNSGEETLTGVTLADDKFAAPAVPGTLTPGQSVTVSATHVLNVTTTNVATVSGTDKGGKTVTATDDATAQIFNPAITIVKTAVPVVILPGELVQYTYLVTNIGDIGLHDVAVTDNVLGPIGTIPVLGIGAQQTLSITVPVNADVTNTGTATGYYGTVNTNFYGSVSANSSAIVDVVHPSIQVVKSASPSVIRAGDTVTYTFDVTNTGDVALYNISVVDDKLGSIGVIPVLAAGATATLSKTATINVTTTNVVVATGMDQYEHQVSDTDTATVTAYNPSISIVKSAAPGTIWSGDNVTYTYLVTNTGDITLTNVHVTDDRIPGTIAVTPSTLAPGASGTASVTVPITADVTNTGTAHGTFGTPNTTFGGEVTAQDTAVVDVIHPAIQVVKSAAPTQVIPGSSVLYTFVVTNVGDVPLHDVSVDDDKLGHIGNVPSLAVGASATLTMSTTLNVSTTNVVTATGLDTLDRTVTDTATANVPVRHPAITLDKTVVPGVVLAGETVTYSYKVTNTGDIALHDVMVTDDKIGAIGTIALLLPGASQTLTAARAIPSDVINLGTATGAYGVVDSDFSGTVTATDTAQVDVVAPAISVTKAPSVPVVIRGDSVTYTYVVKNVGDVPLVNVNLADDKIGGVGTIASLAVGASATFTKTTALSVPTTNTVTATASDAVGHPVSATASAFVDVAAPFTDTAITKTADKKVANPGDIVTYTLSYKVTTGDPVSNIKITDTFDSRYMTPVSVAGGTVANGTITWVDTKALAVGETRTITYTMQVSPNMPVGTTAIKNAVVINPFGAGATWTVNVTVNAPFLPFTGGEWAVLGLIALIAAAAGLALRRLGSEQTS